jgi:predicted oxidoreductase
VFYRLVEPLLANWLLEGLRFLEVAEQRYDSVRLAVSQARQSWAGAAAVNGPDSSDE